MDIEKLANEVVNEILAMEPGSCGTVHEIAGKLAGAWPVGQDDALFDLDDAVASAAEERGILLDKSEFWGMSVGLPYNIPFVVRPIVNGRRGPIGADEVESLIFSAGGYMAGHARMRIAKDEGGAFRKSVKGLLHYGPDVEEIHDEPLSETELSAFAMAIAQCGVESWHRKYPHGTPEVTVLDGGGWELTIALTDGTCVRSVGDNDYPESFEELTVAMTKLGFPEIWS